MYFLKKPVLLVKFLMAYNPLGHLNKNLGFYFKLLPLPQVPH